MMRKILLGTLAFSIFFFGTNVNAFARAKAFENDKTSTAIGRNSDPKSDTSANPKSSNPGLKKALFEKQPPAEIKEKDNLAAYERQKAKGNKFSTTTKVLIGVGIAAAVVGIVVFAASRDDIKTF
jgi:hypothetical protein